MVLKTPFKLNPNLLLNLKDTVLQSFITFNGSLSSKIFCLLAFDSSAKSNQICAFCLTHIFRKYLVNLYDLIFLQYALCLTIMCRYYTLLPLHHCFQNFFGSNSHFLYVLIIIMIIMLYVFPLFCLMVLLIPILLPSSINLSFSASLLWLLIILISFFCFQYFSYSKLNVVYSSLLISESINDLDIIVSILFHLLLDSITILLCFPFLFGVVSNSFFIIPVVMENAKLKLKFAIRISVTITVEKKQ